MPVLVAVILLILTAPLASLSCADAQTQSTVKSELRMGVFPRRSAKVTENIFLPLSQLISEKLGKKITLETTYDFASFWENVANSRYDFVHFNQYHYIKSHKQFGYRVIAQNVEFGQESIAGAILVRKDSGIQSAMDLKGKTVVFGGGRGAMMAYITATYLLRQAGLKKGDYFEQFALNPPKACIATFYRKATAAGAGNYVLDLPHVKKQIDVDEMKYLSVSEKMAHLPWAVSNSVDPKTEQQLQTILVHLNGTKTGREVLKKAKITRFKSASDTDYDLHREIIKSVLGEEY